MRLAIVLTHPIQYYSPVFKMLTDRGNIQINVFYTWEKGSEKFDRGFLKQVEWDLPLLEGYDFTFISNRGNHGRGFWDVINPTLISSIENWNAEGILVFGWNYYSHLSVIRYFKGKIPVFFRGDSHLLDEKKGLKKYIRRLFLRWVYSYVDKALYVGQNNMLYYKKHGLVQQNLIFAPHAIDNYRFKSIETNNALLFRKEHGILPNEIMILFAGKLESKKNPDLLLEVVCKMKMLNLKVMVVGSGPLEFYLKEKYASYPNVIFKGFLNQTQMPISYNACDIFCLPSQGPGETWGLCVNEAMACEKPVIVSDKAGCFSDLVIEDVTGYIFKSGCKDSLEKAIRKFCELHPNQRKKMGDSAGELIEKYSFTAICEAVEFCTKK